MPALWPPRRVLLTPAVRAHLWRIIRFPAFVSLAAALVTPLAHAAAIRWPAIGGIVALLEIIVRTALPTVAATSTPAVPAAKTSTPPADTYLS